MDLILKKPNEKEFQQICNYIQEFELDNRELKSEEFVAAFRDAVLVGFGRIRLHSDCAELCSLGVVTNYRRKGIGKAIVNRLTEMSPDNLFLVCIIPEYFIPLGFEQTTIFPDSINNKIDYCTNELVVQEDYVAMKKI